MQRAYAGGASRDVKVPQHRELPSRELTYPPDKAYLKMIFLFPRWYMLISWRVCFFLGGTFFGATVLAGVS